MKRVLYLLPLLAVFLVSRAGWAMPNFARAAGVECSTCHTNVPKLNKTGYEFRLAGYRFPNTIGQAEGKFDLGDYFAGRIQAQMKYKKHTDVTKSKNSTSNSIEFFEATMYPLSGSWGKNYGSLVELSMAPDDVFEIENAFVRWVHGNENAWWQARFGVMHPWEGFGASDRPIGNMRPLFQKSTAVGSPFFLWNLDEPALEVGFHNSKAMFTISGRISNGILWKEDGSGVADPAQGGSLSKSSKFPGANRKSFQVYADKYFANDASVSVYAYQGAVPFPDPTNPNTTATTLDTFTRFAAYANYYIMKEKLNGLLGFESGTDKLKDNTVAGAANVGSSSGYFAELDYRTGFKTAYAVRYDSFDPSKKVKSNTQTAITASFNHMVRDGLQIIADWQHKETEKGSSGKNKDEQILIRMIFIK